MTAFTSANPAIEPAEHPRNTSHIRASGHASFPAGPVPGDAQPKVVEMPPTDHQPGNQAGEPGLPDLPTAANTRP
jgi:hypothetical protein